MSDAEYTTIAAARADGVTTVTLNRPQIRNAFDETMIAELTACAVGAASGGCRALVFRAAGPVFCAGADLNWMKRAAAYSHEQNLDDACLLERMFAAIAAFPGVTIAIVHGAALGGGAGLVAACDVAIADVETKFALSEVRLGLVPAVVAPYILQRVTPGAARALFVTGERIDAAAAMRIGLVNYVTAGEQEREERLGALLESVIASGPAAIGTAKRLLRGLIGMRPDEAAAITTACIADLRAGDEAREGIAAFLEKRKPRWAGAPRAQDLP
ncbi:MAG TPA: enoyl-CoA hydratase-related protein [Chthonomonadaceae bacterium]|nr:enoyl-CoA hydratase-related protein [Chthonomonadaceae bacterium]